MMAALVTLFRRAAPNADHTTVGPIRDLPKAESEIDLAFDRVQRERGHVAMVWDHCMVEIPTREPQLNMACVRLVEKLHSGGYSNSQGQRLCFESRGNIEGALYWDRSPGEVIKFRSDASTIVPVVHLNNDCPRNDLLKLQTLADGLREMRQILLHAFEGERRAIIDGMDRTKV